MEAWLDTHKHSIEFSFKLVATLIAVGGIGFTLYQLKQTKEALILTMQYNVQKDSRDMLKLFSDDPAFMSKLRVDSMVKLPEDSRYKVAAQAGMILNFYAFALSNDTRSTYSEEFFSRLTQDFCQAARLPLLAARLVAKNENEPYFGLTKLKREKCDV